MLTFSGKCGRIEDDNGEVATVIDGFSDVSGLLGGGVFLLLAKGEVVFVGRASSGTLLAKIAHARSKDRPKWLPRIIFDQVLIRKVHPDQINDVYFTLIAEHEPRYNAECRTPTFAVDPSFRKRI